MIEVLRAKYLRKSRKSGVICFIVGFALALFMFKDWIPVGDVINLDNVKTASEIKEGRASLTVWYIYDYFMYYTEGYDNSEEKAVARDYFVLTGANLDAEEVDHEVYIGVMLEGKKNKHAYKIMNAFWEEENYDWDNSDYIPTKGHVRKMDSGEKEYWEEYLYECAEDAGMSFDEITEYFVPYIYEPNHVTKFGDDSFWSWVISIFAGALIVFGFAHLIQGFFGDPLKDLENYGKKHNGEEAARMKAEILYERNVPHYGMVGDDELFLYDSGSKLFALDPKDILWAYEHVVTRKTNFVTVGKDYSVKVRLANGKTIDMPCPQQDVHPTLSALHDICPDVIFGYSKDIEHEYNKNRQSMINEVLRRREERLNRNSFYSSEGYETPSEPEPVSVEEEAVKTDDDKLDGFFS